MPKNREKIGFPMPTAKNRFHILVLHLKKHIIIEKTPFLCTFTGPLPERHFDMLFHFKTAQNLVA